jgi:hypothetical protein
VTRRLATGEGARPDIGWLQTTARQSPGAVRFGGHLRRFETNDWEL